MKNNRGFVSMLIVVLIGGFIAGYLFLLMLSLTFKSNRHNNLFLQLVETINLLATQLDVAATLQTVTNQSTQCITLNQTGGASPTISNFYIPATASNPNPYTFPLMYNSSSVIPSETTYNPSGITYAVTHIGSWSFIASCVYLPFMPSNNYCVGLNAASFASTANTFHDAVTSAYFFVDPLRNQPLSWNATRQVVSPAFAAQNLVPSGVYCTCPGATNTCLMN